MQQFDFAIITPSYAPDFQRCQLLSWSVEQFVPASVSHYIIVDARDLKLFQQLETQRTKLITVESVLPWWIQHIPFVKNGWFSLKTFVIRNWILQQIVKISIAQYLKQDVLIFVDSDVTFVRHFDPQSLIRDGKVRLFSEPPYPYPDLLERCYPWYCAANQLLGLPEFQYPARGYIGNIITWKRDNVLKMYEHIEKVSGQGWLETLCKSWNLSEYILYGVFVEQILKEESGHYCDPVKLSLDYWKTDEMSDVELQKFFTQITPEQVSVMISAKAGISVEKYQNLLEMVPQI
ncbi:MAG: DUF6492 family protein [Nostocaceae cyanobacterium]|nr:DUF6492 family protein [Nostocaceae cyanobacterium]